MVKNKTNLIGIFITILVGSYFYVNFCSECGKVKKEIDVPTLNVIPYPFAFSDEDFAYSVNENFNFNVSSSAILMPVSKGLQDGIMELKTYLSNNPGRTINITGYHKADEDNLSAFPNLGLARSNAVKNYFVSQGIPSKKINSIGRRMDELVAKGSIYQGPLSYSFEKRVVDIDESLETLSQKIKDDIMVLHFNTAETSITLTHEQRQQFAAISRYLDKVEKAKILVVGHTDDTGLKARNLKIGQNRADFAKAYLVENGISESRIKVISKGFEEPIAGNATKEGKAKNRRTTITIN
ncbi:MAG: OmpA family protein [Maribacter sp.]|nr:OmpA family protein [Maribacter sp.]